MSQHNNIKLEDRLRDELKDASFLPPPAAWDRIEAALPGGHPWYVRHRWLVSAAVLLIAFFSTYFFHQTFISESTLLAEGIDQSEPAAEIAALSPQKAGMGLSSTSEGLNIASGEKSSEISVSKTAGSGQNPTVLIADQNVGKKAGSAPKMITTAPTANSQKRNNNQSGSKASAPNQKNQPSNTAVNAFDLTNPIHANEWNKAPATAEAFTEAVAIGYQPPMLALDKIDYVDDESKFTVKAPVSSKSKKQKKNFNLGKGFYMGPTFGMNYNLMSKAPMDKDADFSSLQYRPHFGSSLGLSFGYDFSSRFGLVVDWIYSSDEGQRFAQEVDGRLTDLSIELDYMKFPVLLKYKHKFLSENGKNPIVLNFTGGFHYSVLRSRNTFINDELAYFDQKHNQHQWGLLGGAEVDIYATKQLFFTIGARAGFNAGTEGFPRMKGPDGSNPIAFQTGAFARLNYRFSKAMGGEATKPQAFE
jgi:hypothetical protein